MTKIIEENTFFARTPIEATKLMPKSLQSQPSRAKCIENAKNQPAYGSRDRVLRPMRWVAHYNFFSAASMISGLHCVVIPSENCIR